MPTDGVPSRRELTAAYWTGRVLTPDGLTRGDRQASYRTLPVAGRLDFEDLRAAESLLRSSCLAHHDAASDRLTPSLTLQGICELHESAAIELLLAAILEHQAPMWLLAATGGSHLRDELVPDGAQRVLESLLDDPGRREAFLLARGRKVEADQRAAIGELGEQAVVAAATDELLELGYPDLAAQVRQVSAISDELGYDVVAPRLKGSSRRLEVKTTQVATTAVTIYLTRNEAAVGMADANWSVVICALQSDDTAEIIGWLRAAELTELLPVNSHQDGTWETARIRVATSDLIAGLPPP